MSPEALGAYVPHVPKRNLVGFPVAKCVPALRMVWRELKPTVRIYEIVYI